MDENARKKREWVKTAAIIFLSVMLVLTFFSNTIMNYSLPEVAIQYVQSGTVTAKIRGSGVVESGDPYNVEVKESRKVASVAVRVGDFVEKGDVILYLEDEESEELKTAQDALDQAWNAYEKALLSDATTAAALQISNSGTSVSTYRQQLTNAQKVVKDAQNRVDDLKEQADVLSNRISNMAGRDEDIRGLQEWVNNTLAAKNDADRNKKSAQSHLDALKGYQKQWENEMDYWSQLSVSSGNAGNTDKVAEAQNQIANLQRALEENQKAILDAEAALNEATIEFNNKEAEWTKATNALANETAVTKGDLERQLANVNEELTNANAVLKEKTDLLTEMTGALGQGLNLGEQMEAITKAQEKVDELTEKSIGATVTADISGTITALNVVAGNTTSAATPVAVMQPEGKGFSMSFSVTNEQAKRLAVGDRADLVNAWRFDDVEVVLASIKPDPNDPGQKKLLTFDVTGAVTAGQTLNISVGQKSANYDYIVPNNAIREDNNGKFILVVTSKSSPLGTRYVATRVDVEVLASDDNQSAVSSGMLTGYDPVITTSTKPVEAGKLVRLAENN
ncbi:MAG: HlyD family efflux transporter periplasmic adaptor subunit [Lachnospiraceae bacterium]|nr:HlyD family efflux transporter periplasmic adaptor subunit [Lachnospiraceae bacterium]